MATRTVELTTEPKDIIAELNFSANESFKFQNVGIENALVAELTSKPDSSSRNAHIYPPLSEDDFTVGTEKLFCWVARGVGRLIVTESV